MQCINPLKASFDKAGNLTFSSKKRDQGLEPFAFECRKCLPCRLNQSREKGIRCFHEKQMHENSIFLTLTYSDEHLESPKLIYPHFQDFIRALRDKQGHEPENKITYIVTGEYGDKNKRPHWHAILFNYRPSDQEYKYTTDRGDECYHSKTIDSLWKKGAAEYGEVTLDSASYVARYAAKKLVHGKDKDHDYHPVHKTSSRRAIGRTWIEKHWRHTFENGFVVVNGQKMKIPRYYVDWLQKHKYDEWLRYVTQVRPKIQALAKEKAEKEMEVFLKNLDGRDEAQALSGIYHPYPEPRSKVNETILKLKFKRLTEMHKL